MRIKILAIFICLTTIAHSQKKPIYQSAISWYSMDGSGADSIGTNNLTIVNQVNFVQNSIRGRVADLDASRRSYFRFQQSPVDGNRFTFTTWFYWKSTAVRNWSEIFSLNNGANYFYFTPRMGSNGGYAALMNSQAQGTDILRTNVSLVTNTWVHLAVVVDRKRVQLYLNGTKVAEQTNRQTISTINPNSFVMGYSERDNIYTGALYDDVAIFDYPLSSNQIQSLARDQVPVRPADSVPYIVEVEDYEKAPWTKNTYDSITYLQIDTQALAGEAANNALLYGMLNGSGSYSVWGLINTVQPVSKPFLFRENNLPWSESKSLGATSGWEWKILYRSALLGNGMHTMQLAPVSPGVKIDKLLITRDWGLDPRSYIPSDIEKPLAPSVVAVIESSVTATGATVKWKSGADNIGITGYDVYANGQLVHVSADTSAIIPLLASTSYEIKVRAKDAGGNVSGFSPPVFLRTKENAFAIDLKSNQQMIHHFGASDAWGTEGIGKRWPEEKKETMARWLFSQENDSLGNPMGIGLSMWRFQIGNGSAEQVNSGYSAANEYKEMECFLNPDGTYNWSKQQGSRWFLAKAKEYGIKNFSSWINSPPYFMTKNGYVFRTSGQALEYNLKDDLYDDYAAFLTTVSKRLEDEGYPMTTISPVNEPQYQWNYTIGSAAQDGSYAKNQEVARVVREMDAKFSEQGVQTKIMIPEAGSALYMFEPRFDPLTSNQLVNFWTSAGTSYIGNLPNVSNHVAGHSYLRDTDINQLISDRQRLKMKMTETDPSLDYWQTEYSILGTGYLQGRQADELEPMDYGLWLASRIHLDLTEAKATAWSFWTALNLRNPAGDSDNRFGLITYQPNATRNDGTFESTKLLWTLGNFSRFVRPGMKAVNLTRNDNLATAASLQKQFMSAYVDEEDDKAVVVVVNNEDRNQNVDLRLSRLPSGKNIIRFTPYITNRDQNLTKAADFKANIPFTMPAKSVVTFVTSEVTDSLVVEYRAAGGTNDNQILAFVRIMNYGNRDVPYKNIKLKYWFTAEDTVGLSASVIWPGGGFFGASGKIRNVNPALDLADRLLEISFSNSCSALQAGKNSGFMLMRVYKNTGRVRFDDTNDYSFIDERQWVRNENITLYQEEILAWGNEPIEPMQELSSAQLVEEEAIISDGRSTDKQIHVFPNPFDSRLHLKYDEITEIQSITLRDFMGNLIMNCPIDPQNIRAGLIELDLPIEEGTYLLEVRLTDRTEMVRVIKR
jgi:O-glycosyl hydrolase